jgi:hypothetical protein
MNEIEKNDINLNISRYISTAVGEEEIDHEATNQTLVDIEKDIQTANPKHNAFLKDLELNLLRWDETSTALVDDDAAAEFSAVLAKVAATNKAKKK